MRELATLFIRSFSGKNSFAHGAAILVTFLFVITGIDWQYFLFMNSNAPHFMLFTADMVGLLVPILLPLSILMLGILKKNATYLRTGTTLVKTVVLAFLIALTYKSLAGRESPPDDGPLIDNSNQFHFGFMEHSVLGGWPSSHATVMFALAACLVTLFPKSVALRVSSYALALSIGLGVAIGFHWISEFIAGVLIGTVIGKTVAQESRGHLRT
jgi:membrane-associated phospholipid phosphatase